MTPPDIYSTRQNSLMLTNFSVSEKSPCRLEMQENKGASEQASQRAND